MSCKECNGKGSWFDPQGMYGMEVYCNCSAGIELQKSEQLAPTNPVFKFYKIKHPGGFMSNYYRSRFFIYGRWWYSVEHAYQAQKCSNPIEYDAIHQTTKANEARLLGQKVEMREHWDTIHKDHVMEECLRAKFLQNKDLRHQLMKTGDQELVENSPVDWYWGCGADGTGKNMLGKLLMKIRRELQGE